ncbi:MAG: T9SS type A sorting domain-containing protein [Flavobacteriales bacterium]
MSTPSLLPCIVVATLFTTQVHGQWDLHFDGTVPVTRAGNTLDLAWAGGINFVHVSDIDLNGDGMKDLFLFDRSGNKVTTLLRTTGTGVMGYVVTHDYDGVEPLAPLGQPLHDWALLRDFNCDGKEDIFTYSQAGFSVFKNVSAGGDPAFELYTYRANSNYVSPSGAGTIANLFVSQVDLPGIEDIDGDGDLDILTFSLLGSYLEYHKNLSMELYGTCDSLAFEVRNSCWGYFAENFSNNSVTLNVPCTFNVPAPEMGGGGGNMAPEHGGVANERTHAGSAVLPIDLNGDGVKDLLLGDISYNNMVGLYNGGTVVDGIMTQEDTLFPTYDVSVDLTVFPGGSYEDVDADGKRDLLASPAATSLAQNFESLWYYHNTGTDASPVFDFVQTNLFQDRMVELGEGAYPVLFDHDGDGLMDLVVANYGYFYSGGAYVGKMALLRNTGTTTAPSFEMLTDDYMDLSTSGIGLSMYPAFGDVDGDGDKDMYVGDLQGRLHFYRNTPVGSVASFVLEQPNITDADGVVIDVGQFATPIFSDLDGDGLLDMIIGERNGNLNHYRNTGTAAVPSWTLISESLGGVSTIEWWNVTGHSVPFLFVNSDGDREMVLGSESGWLYHYGDIEGNIGGTWNLIDSTFLDLRDGERTALCLYDFTGDSTLDMVVGNYRGGLSFWRSDLPSSTHLGSTTAQGFIVMPNPASGTVELLVPNTAIDGDWQLQNSIGQVLIRGRVEGPGTTLDVSDLPDGVYLVRLLGDASATQRLIVAHGRR